MKCRLLALIVFSIVAVTCCSMKPSDKGQGAPTTVSQAPVVAAVFIFSSEACDCEKQRTQDALLAMEYFLKHEDSRTLKRVDVANSPEKLKAYQKQTKISFLPVLIGLDDNGIVVEKIEGIFENKHKALETIFF